MPVCGIDTSSGAVPRVTVSQGVVVIMPLPKSTAALSRRQP